MAFKALAGAVFIVGVLVAGRSGAVQDAVLEMGEDGSLHINTTAGESSRVYVNGIDVASLDDKVEDVMRNNSVLQHQVEAMMSQGVRRKFIDNVSLLDSAFCYMRITLFGLGANSEDLLALLDQIDDMSHQLDAINDTILAIEPIPGPEGPVGEKGNRGDFGAQGPKGFLGDGGDRGDLGSKGDSGDIGQRGDVGPKGFQGAVGETGDVGARGDQGVIGVQGPVGDKGNVGDKGVLGDVGLKGDTGPSGIKGVKGNVGAKGNRGAQGTKGHTGDQGIQGAKGNKGTTGAKGQTGAPGPTGNTGAAGGTGIKGVKGSKGPQSISGVRHHNCNVEYSSCQDAADRDNEFLDRQDPQCSNGRAMAYIKFGYHGCSHPQMRYQFTCCMLTPT